MGELNGRKVLAAALAFFLDVHDFVFVDKEIGRAFAGEPDHVAVVVLNPAVHDLAIGQLYAYGLLLFAEQLEVRSLFKRIFGGDNFSLVGTVVGRIHAGGHEYIVQAEGFSRDAGETPAPHILESHLQTKLDSARRAEGKNSSTETEAIPYMPTKPVHAPADAIEGSV